MKKDPIDEQVEELAEDRSLDIQDLSLEPTQIPDDEDLADLLSDCFSFISELPIDKMSKDRKRDAKSILERLDEIIGWNLIH